MIESCIDLCEPCVIVVYFRLKIISSTIRLFLYDLQTANVFQWRRAVITIGLYNIQSYVHIFKI